jgi:hypothetical protein
MSFDGFEGDDELERTPVAWTPKSDAEREAIREQLGRILSSALFRNSKRFPAFIQFTVEHALSSSGPLKERTIGHEVFGREAGYDTAQDPVVRMTATEVRKRLAQYYQLLEHANETIIGYQPGSYVPEFYLPEARSLPEVPAAAVPAAPEKSRAGFARWAAAALAAAASLVLVVGLMWGRLPGSGANAVARFWAPILNSAAPVLVCIGDTLRIDQGREPDATAPGDITIEQFLRSNTVRYTDSVTLATLAGELRARGKPFRIRRPAATELKDLRDGPVVLIGGFNNSWTLRLSAGLRFQLATDPVTGSYIRDRERPDNRQWTLGDRTRQLKTLQQTYGLITRVEDPATGHSVLTVSGLVFGTRAAGECLIDAECLGSTERLGGNWDHHNMQIVVTAAVIGEDSGAPRVVAAHSW